MLHTVNSVVCCQAVAGRQLYLFQLYFFAFFDQLLHPIVHLLEELEILIIIGLYKSVKKLYSLISSISALP